MMRRRHWLVVPMLLLPIGTAAAQEAAPADAPAAAPDGALARVAWLAGCWEGGSTARLVEEHWLPPRGGTMLGAARTTRGDSTTSVEWVVLRARGDTLAYEAHPVGQAPAVFLAVTVPSTDSSITFANPAHDFPQRIRYARIGRDSLVARIEGNDGGSVRGIDYPMRRVGCPTGP